MKKVSEYLKTTGFILLLICCLALFIRVLCFVALQPWDEQVRNKIIVGDDGYHRLALSIMTPRSFSNYGTFKTPGYPVLIAFIYFLFGTEPWIVLFLQLFLDTGIVIIVYFIAKEIFKSKQISLIAAFLYSISFPSAYYSVKLFTEIPFTFILALAILIFIRSIKKNKLSGFALTGFFIGLITLIRPIAQYFPLVLLIVLVLSNSKPIEKLRNAVILLMLFFIVISTWQFRNLQVYDHYALSHIQGHNLCRHYVAMTKAHVENISEEEAIKKLIGTSLKGVTNPFEQSRIYQEIALSYISKHPLQYMKYHLKGILRMFLGTARSGMSELLGIKTERAAVMEPLSYTAHKIIKNFHNELPTLILLMKQMLEYMFVIIGLIIMRLKDKKIFSVLLIMIICYFALLTGPIGHSRFRIPIIPFYLIISAKGVFETFKFARNKIIARRMLLHDV